MKRHHQFDRNFSFLGPLFSCYGSCEAVHPSSGKAVTTWRARLRKLSPATPATRHRRHPFLASGSRLDTGRVEKRARLLAAIKSHGVTPRLSRSGRC